MRALRSSRTALRRAAGNPRHGARRTAAWSSDRLRCRWQAAGRPDPDPAHRPARRRRTPSRNRRGARKARAYSPASARRCGPAAHGRGNARMPCRRALVAAYSPGNRSWREVWASTSWMAATMLTRAVGAKPNVVAAGRTEARIVEDLSARHDQLHRAAETRAATAASTVCICSEFFWPKPPPAKGEITSTCSGGRPSAVARPWRMASAFCVPS